MPEPPRPNSEAFRDMSLPERQRPLFAPIAPIDSPKPESDEWHPGDRVLAPWEPMFLYAARIVEIQGDRANIRFDGGDMAWIELDRLEDCDLAVGDPVDARRSTGMHYYAGEVSARNGDDVRVRFDDGTEEWTTLAMVRLDAGTDNRPVPGSPVLRQGTLANAEEGDRVWAPWTADRLYVGVVEQVEGMEAHINFGNGNRGWVQLDQLARYSLPVGLRIQGRWLRGAIYYSGIVDQVVGERIHIQYDDGDQEWTTPDVLAYPCVPYGPPARATRRAFNFPWRTLAWIAVIVGFICMRACR